MKNTLLAIAIVLLLAGLAFADTVTWTAAVNTDFTNVGNWTGGVPAADGDTIDSTTATAPATNRPTEAGETYHFSITNAVTVTISSFLNGAAIGNVTVDNAGATVYCGGAITGNVVVTNGLFWPTNITISGTTNVAAAGTWTLVGTNTAVGEVTLAGALNLVSNAVLDCSVPLRVTASTAAVDWGTTGDIRGGFNAAGSTVAPTNTTSADLVCDVAGTLDLGTTTANSIVVTNTAAVTIGNSFACGTFSMGANVAGASKTLTVGAGGFAMTAGTLSGTLTVNLSAGAGAYTQTDGTIAADAVLNVTAGSGGITFTDITKTGTLNVTLPVGVTTTTFDWDSITTKTIDALTINGTCTFSGVTTCKKTLAGSGTVNLAANNLYLYYPPASNFITFDGSMTATTGGFTLYIGGGDVTNAAEINFGSVGFWLISNTNARTLTATGGLTCGTLQVQSPNAVGNWTSLVIGTGASLSCTNVTLGYAGDRSGRLTLGSGGVHTISGDIIIAGTGTANALNLQGRLNLGGTFTGTDIIVTPTYEGQVDCGGVGKVTAVTSTGRRLIVRSAVHSTTGIPLRGWQDDSCVNVMFKGRKVIGEPGVN